MKMIFDRQAVVKNDPLPANQYCLSFIYNHYAMCFILYPIKGL